MRSEVIRTTAAVKELVLDAGAVVVGVAGLSGVLQGTPTKSVHAVVFGLRYPNPDVELLPDDEVLQVALRRLAHTATTIYEDVTEFIRREAPSACCCRSDNVRITFGEVVDTLSQKAIAVLGGLGWIGKSSLLVSPIHGPRMRLGTLFTDAPLMDDEPYVASQCGVCRMCLDACPVRAVRGEEVQFEGSIGYRIDAGRCVAHLTRNESEIGRREFCGVCLKECPFRSGLRSAG